MKIEKTKINIESGGVAAYEEQFQIGNVGRIMKILRNSMYANPIKAIVREIASNARDAHREKGCSERPIEVHIPNEFDNHYSIKDYGPGISPDRMSNVFIRYGTSTKNEDNVQTGGFGLGAKTPFAYSDMFNITTVTTDDNGKNVKRIYTAYIDESEAGKMRLVSEQETDEETGTEISIIVDEVDFNRFADATIDVCQYWEPRPKLTGRRTPEWVDDPRELFLNEPRWKMYKNSNDYDNHTSLAIVDGIAYPINPNNLDELSWDSNEYKLLTKGLKLIIETGEVTLSANREELQYDEKTQKAIKDRLSEIMDRVSELLVQQVNEHDNYHEAALFYHDFRGYLAFAIPDSFVPEWKGHKLCSLKITLDPDNIAKKDNNGNKIASYHIDEFEFRRNRRTYGMSLHKETCYQISIDKESAIILNDLNQERVSRNRVEYFLQNDPDLKKVYVVSFSDLAVKAGLEQMKKDNKWNADINWFNPVLMSTINPPRKQGKRRGGRGSGRSSYKAFIYDSSYTAYRSCDAGWRPTEVDMTEGEGVYVVVSGRTNDISSQKHKLTNNQINKIVAYADDDDFAVYGIREKDIPRLGEGWVPLKIWLDAKVDEALEERDLTVGEIATVMKEHESVFFECKSDISQQLSGLIKNRRNEIPATSVMLQYYDLSLEIAKQRKDLMKLWQVATIFPRPNSDLNKSRPLAELAEAFTVTYPMLKAFRSWNGPTGSVVFDYILLVDREAERQAALDNDVQDDQPIAVNE